MGQVTGVDSSGISVLFFSQNLPAPPYTSVSLKLPQNFQNSRNSRNTDRIRKRVVMTDNNPFLTDNWEYI